MVDALGYAIAALITGVFAVIVVLIQIRANRALARNVTAVHEEVRTNHGLRQGQRIEDLGIDVSWIRNQMVTKQELADHATHDEVVAAGMATTIRDTKDELLTAIRGGTEKQ